MTIKASISFTACGNYDNQFTTPVLYPAITSADFDPYKGWLHNLRRTGNSAAVNPINVPGAWRATRFNFKMNIEFPTVSKHFQDGCVIYGYTDPTESPTSDTRLYITRMVGFIKSTHIEAGAEVERVRSRYDILIIPANDLDERRFIASPKGVLRRIGTEMMFSQFNTISSETLNLTSEQRKLGSSTVSFHDLDVEKWVESAEGAIRSATMGANDWEGEELLQCASDVCDPVSLRHTRFHELLRRTTDFEFNGYFTYRELQIACPDLSNTCIDSNVRGGPGTPEPSTAAQMIFDDFVKKAAVEASMMGNERLHKEWSDDGINVSESVIATRSLFAEGTWIDIDDEGFDVHNLGEFIETAKTEVTPPPMRLPVMYAVDKYRVNINLDLAGDIIGVVTINDTEEYHFVKPAFSLALGSGLSVTHVEMEDVCKLVGQLVYASTINKRNNSAD